MNTHIFPEFETVAPSEADTLLARESSIRLATHALGPNTSVRIQFLDETNTAEIVAVPASAVRLFFQVLNEMSQGNSVTLIPNRVEFTTQQAAEFLNVSPRFLIKLLDAGQIPEQSNGTDRRIRLDDLLAYKRNDDEEKAKILEQLTAEAQELGLGY